MEIKLKMVLLLSENGGKGKNLFPFGAFFFPFRVDPFQIGVGMQECKNGVIKVFTLVELQKINQVYSVFLQ